MRPTRFLVWLAALAATHVLGVGGLRGADVTVVGSRWLDQSAPVFASPNAKQDAPLPPGSSLLGPEGQDSPQSRFFDQTPGETVPNVSPRTDEGPLAGFLSTKYEHPGRIWTLDYRCRVLGGSGTSAEWGTPELPPLGWNPLTHLDFPVNSLWHGLRGSVEERTWDIHFEWMMPQQGITGDTVNCDWNPPNPDGSYTDLGKSSARWSDGWGQMIDIGGEFRWKETLFGLPIEVWPTVGFRWQRFQLTCFDLFQYKENNVWLDPPDYYSDDSIDFNQQYYMAYYGGQFRTRVGNISMMFQADWGYTWAYNVAHYLLVDGDRYTMDNTYGGSWHLAFNAAVPLDERIAIGFQVDYLQIFTEGKHHLLNLPVGQDMVWSHGVKVLSNQAGVTGFVRVRF